MKVLHIDSSPVGPASVTRQLTAAVVAALRATNQNVEVVHRDLAAMPPPHLGSELLQVLRPQPGAAAPDTARLREDIALTEALLDEFLAADTVVIGAPMYNFSVPSQLKAWIDRIAQAGRTFRYTATGPEGLVGGKKVVLVSSRGGLYAGKPFELALDHQEAYLRGVMQFLGITDLALVRAEGVNLGPEARDEAIRKALRELPALAAEVA